MSSSFCKYLSRSLSSPDDKLSENIWFVWSKTSYDGYKWRCYHGDDERRTISENRASQQIYQGLLTFAMCMIRRQIPHQEFADTNMAENSSSDHYWKSSKKYFSWLHFYITYIQIEKWLQKVTSKFKYIQLLSCSHLLCFTTWLQAPLVNGKHGGSGLNAQPLVARGPSSGLALAVNQPSEAIRSVRGNPRRLLLA